MPTTVGPLPPPMFSVLLLCRLTLLEARNPLDLRDARSCDLRDLRTSLPLQHCKDDAHKFFFQD